MQNDRPGSEEISNELGDKLKIAKLNVDENPSSAQRYGVMSIPTLIVFKNGQAVDKIIGFQPKEALLNTINKNL